MVLPIWQEWPSLPAPSLKQWNDMPPTATGLGILHLPCYTPKLLGRIDSGISGNLRPSSKRLAVIIRISRACAITSYNRSLIPFFPTESATNESRTNMLPVSNSSPAVEVLFCSFVPSRLVSNSIIIADCIFLMRPCLSLSNAEMRSSVDRNAVTHSTPRGQFHRPRCHRPSAEPVLRRHSVGRASRTNRYLGKPDQAPFQGEAL